MKILAMFLFFITPISATASETWAGNLAKVLVETSSSLSLELFLVLQDALFPVFVVISLFWIVALVISQFISEKALRGSELGKEIFKRGIIIGFVSVFLTTDVSWLFDLTISPLIDLALGYGGEIMGATDNTFSKCMLENDYTISKGFFSATLQKRFICILEYLFNTLMFGVDLGIGMLISGLASFIFPPLMIIKLMIAVSILKSFSSLMIDLLWRFIDTLFYFITGVVLLPFTFIGWAFSEDKTELMPYFSTWGKLSIDRFKKGTINLIFWCITIAFIHFLLQQAIGEFSTFIGEKITPEKIMNKDPAFYNTDGSLKVLFIAQLSFTFLLNLKGWLMLFAVGILGKYIVTKIEETAKAFGASNQEVYEDLKTGAKSLKDKTDKNFKGMKDKFLEFKNGG